MGEETQGVLCVVVRPFGRPGGNLWAARVVPSLEDFDQIHKEQGEIDQKRISFSISLCSLGVMESPE